MFCSNKFILLRVVSGKMMDDFGEMHLFVIRIN